ncbi:MAG TPA: glycoside hydrolase family 3 N-terminal domain-containing protein [Acidimicrobiales bacterium]|nr:glycoside hydrolase family 3 N-terminal domain-containing protein [Acidimicrobiales bacterium]
MRPAAFAVAALLVATTAACSGSGHPGAVRPTLPTATSTSVAPATTVGTEPLTTAGATTSTTNACSDAAVIRSWPVSRRAAQLVVVPVLAADPAAVQVAVKAGAGGLLLLGSVPPGPQLVAALHAAIADPETPRPFVMVDQEGGGVQRLGSDVVSIPWPRQMVATMTTAQVQQLAERLARQMAALGVGVDLAPVLDLDGGPSLSSSDPDGPRSFSTDPSVAASYGLAFASGLRAGGVLAVAKHFPGLGESTGNTDYGPASTRPLSDLERAGLIPFQRAVAGGVGAVMVANAGVPGLTSQPASVSAPVVTGLLRKRLGFTGLVMTDSLSAGAIRAAGYSVESAAAASIEAGSDMILFGSTLTPADTAQLQPGPLAALTQSVVAAISKAVATGALPQSRLDDAVLHVVRAKGARLC